MASSLALLIVIFIFFRQEMSSALGGIYQKYPYTLMAILLSCMTYFTRYYYNDFLNMIGFLTYNFHQLQRTMSHLLAHVVPQAQTMLMLNLILRAMVFGILLYFPEYYQKKYASLIYREQVKTVQWICYYLLLIMVLVFASKNL